MRPVRDLESGLIEVIKYGAKIFTEPDLDNKMQGDITSTIYADALYNIFDGMKGYGCLIALVSTFLKRQLTICLPELLLIMMNGVSCRNTMIGLGLTMSMCFLIIPCCLS